MCCFKMSDFTNSYQQQMMTNHFNNNTVTNKYKTVLVLNFFHLYFKLKLSTPGTDTTVFKNNKKI